MELSSGQQRALFVAIVVVLAGLGIYIIGPGGHHGASAAPTATSTSTPTPTPVPTTAAPVAPAPTSAPAVQPSATTGSASTAATSGQANIYSWLPFTQQDLTSAAKTTVAFANDYGTWSYTESATAYVDKMSALITPELAGSLKATYAPPGVLQQRETQKQVSSGSAGITQLSSFAPASIAFDVTIEQKLTTSKGITTNSTSYVVTCVQDASGWTVNDIELASAGNTGVGNP